jgi:poly(A) polymerase
LCLRAATGEVSDELADWWEEFQYADDTIRQDLMAQAKKLRDEQQRGQAVRVRSPKAAKAAPRADADPTRTDSPACPELPPDASFAEESDAPAKKRRRRRKPKAAGDGAGSGQYNPASE